MRLAVSASWKNRWRGVMTGFFMPALYSEMKSIAFCTISTSPWPANVLTLLKMLLTKSARLYPLAFPVSISWIVFALLAMSRFSLRHVSSRFFFFGSVFFREQLYGFQKFLTPFQEFVVSVLIGILCLFIPLKLNPPRPVTIGFAQRERLWNKTDILLL